jgi:hypothetical protein
VFANSSIVMLGSSSATQNVGHGIGGCTIRAVASKGLVLAGTRFEGNRCTGNSSAVAGNNYAATQCPAGGASLMVSSGLPKQPFDTPPACALARKHLVHISDSTFVNEQPLFMSCGGTALVESSFLELQRTTISGSHEMRTGSVTAVDSVVVAQQLAISDGWAKSNGAAMFVLRGKLWALQSRFFNNWSERDAGGCLYIVDASEVLLLGGGGGAGGGGAWLGCLCAGRVLQQPQEALLSCTPSPPPPRSTCHAARLTTARPRRRAVLCSTKSCTKSLLHLPR